MGSKFSCFRWAARRPSGPESRLIRDSDLLPVLSDEITQRRTTDRSDDTKIGMPESICRDLGECHTELNPAVWW